MYICKLECCFLQGKYVVYMYIHSFSSSLNTNLHSNSYAFEIPKCAAEMCLFHIDRDLIRIH